MNGYELLANGIILQAVKDYKKALRTLKRAHNPLSAKALYARQVKAECEEFFHGEWFKTLTEIDGNKIIQRMREIS